MLDSDFFGGTLLYHVLSIALCNVTASLSLRPSSISTVRISEVLPATGLLKRLAKVTEGTPTGGPPTSPTSPCHQKPPFASQGG